MSSGTEIEAKFLTRDLGRLATRLAELDARIVQPRMHERNIRFDRPDGSLRLAKQVLRLRQDDKARLTFKGPGEDLDGIHARQEIEFVVEDFAQARQFLEALGYHAFSTYEKFRTTYALNDTLVMLDEMPFGSFVEIEGPDTRTIAAVSGLLGLELTCSLCESYLMLFDRVRHNLGLKFNDLSFENFEGITVPPSAFGKEYAD